jgi:manganese-dependent inorganic pyrophosphatase
MTKNSRVAAENLVRPFMAEAAKAEELPMIFYMFTDVKSQSTDLMIFGNGAEDVVAQAFDVKPKDGMALLKGVVSRKKQIIPPIMATLQKIDEDA